MARPAIRSCLGLRSCLELGEKRGETSTGGRLLGRRGDGRGKRLVLGGVSRWRRGEGVEPSGRREARQAGFEDRPGHRTRSPSGSKLPAECARVKAARGCIRRNAGQVSPVSSLPTAAEQRRTQSYRVSGWVWQGSKTRRSCPRRRKSARLNRRQARRRGYPEEIGSRGRFGDCGRTPASKQESRRASFRQPRASIPS